MVSLGSVTPGYFPALGTRLLGGRFFSDEDEVRDDGVVVLSESAARFFLPEGDPVGKLPRATRRCRCGRPSAGRRRGRGHQVLGTRHAQRERDLRALVETPRRYGVSRHADRR